MKKVKNTIPVVDICSLKSMNQMNSDFIAEPLDKYLLAHPNLHLPHRHSFYHLILFTKGAGTHNIDFQQFEVTPRQVYFMKPGQVHSWNFKGKTEGYVINFSENLFSHFLANGHYLEQFQFLQGIADECVIDLEKETYREASNIIEHIVAEAHSSAIHTPDLVRLYLLELFMVIDRSLSTHTHSMGKPQNQVLLDNFRKLVDTHYAEMRLPKDYAAMLYITPNYLNALCKDLLGRSAGELIRDRILLEAKRLLINADLTISGIASTLDFTDNAHFSRFFKKHTGATPDEFRKNISVNA